MGLRGSLATNCKPEEAEMNRGGEFDNEVIK